MKKITFGVLIIFAFLAKASQAEPSTDLSRKARELKTGMSSDQVRNLLGYPTSVISPKNLKANDFYPSQDIHFVLIWNNPGCSRVEVIFDRNHRATGWDGGELCFAQKALPAPYSCKNSINSKYCSE